MGERDSTPTDDSVVVAVVRDLRDLADWLETSTAVRTYRRASATVATAAAHSALARLLALLTAWLRHSLLYRWLTKEPNPEVVVVDLRETYTVGPVIAVLDRVVPRFERWWSASTLDRLLDRTTSQFERAPIRALSVVVAAAVLANLLLLAVATGTPSPTALLARVVLLVAALAGTRVRTSWDALARARTVRLLAAALEPPEPSDETRRE